MNRRVKGGKVHKVKATRGRLPRFYCGIFLIDVNNTETDKPVTCLNCLRVMEKRGE